MLDRGLLQELDLHLDGQAQERMNRYLVLLDQANQVMDLTQVPTEEWTLRHVADSLIPLKAGWFDGRAMTIDVGSGAGLPGLPLAIARPTLPMTLLDATRKRCIFLQNVVDELGLEHVQVVHGRAEDLARGPLRESFDLALARALAPLSTLMEYLLPLVRPGGMALCWKGPALMDELQVGKKAAHLLGGHVDELIDMELPGRTSLLQIVNKERPSPKAYPRGAAAIKKNPLGM